VALIRQKPKESACQLCSAKPTLRGEWREGKEEERIRLGRKVVRYGERERKGGKEEWLREREKSSEQGATER
jgi:hypothetical protein